MSTAANDIDRDVFLGFIDESREGLAGAESAIIALEADPQDADLMAAIFRAAHSLKGNSAFFGLMHVKTLAHRMEDLLDAVRQKQVHGFRQVIDALLPGLDLLRRMLESVRDGGPELTEPDVLDRTLNGLDQVLQNKGATDPSLASIRRTIEAAREHLPENLKFLLDEALRLTNAGEEEDIKILPATSQKPLKKLLEQPFDDVAGDVQLLEIEKALDVLTNMDAEPETRVLLTRAREIFDSFRNSPVGLDNTAREMMYDIAVQLPQLEAKDRETATEKTKTAKPASAGKMQGNGARTLRIAEKSLDAFLDHVGELIGIEEMLRYCLRQAGKTSGTGGYHELKQVVEQFCKVSAALRSGIMETRKVQAKTLLDKAHRLVRDIAANAGKQIKVQITGGDMRIDKNYADLLDAPLVHMVRNAADHGIETPDEREHQGKPVEGTIHIGLVEYENDIRFTISDDGRGLNRNALTDKAVDMGLVEPGRPLSEDDLVRLLFTSGMSTAAEITDISGRGVGMDVVKQAIESAGGRIKVESSTGSGSVFTIILPKNVNTKIIDGYLVRGKNNSTYVLPLKFVLEAFVAGRNVMTTIKGQGRVVKRRESLHPVLDINTAIQGNNANPGVTSGSFAGEATLVLLDIGGRTVALAVSDIVGVQKVVVKPIDGLEFQNSVIEGAAVMGDGTVALILGEQGLASLLANIGPAAPSFSKNVKEETTL